MSSHIFDMYFSSCEGCPNVLENSKVRILRNRNKTVLFATVRSVLVVNESGFRFMAPVSSLTFFGTQFPVDIQKDLFNQ